jgi:peptidoglycan/LPS O-acetylase OafA/YrhL
MLDAWRGLACLAVVAHHAGYVIQPEDLAGAPGGVSEIRRAIDSVLDFGAAGVTLFFVISGYGIAASADGIRRRGGTSGEFLRRRFWRIYPPYWFALAGYVAVVVVLDALGLGWLHRGPYVVELDPPHWLGLAEWLANISLTETLRPHLIGDSRNVYTAVAWSLCYEVQFYAVCALALALAPRRLFGALAGVTVACLGLQAYARYTDHWWPLAGTFALWWEQFAVGLAVYWRLWSGAGRLARGVDLGLIALAGYGVATDDLDMTIASGFGLLLIALHRLDDPARWPGWLRALQGCGQRSYSVYLVHLPVVVVLSMVLIRLGLTGFWARVLVVIPLASIAGAAAGWPFFAWVESRFLMGRDTGPERPPPWPVRLGDTPSSA